MHVRPANSLRKGKVCFMLILTNGLTETVDEGYLKVANSLIKRIKSKTDVQVISYERSSEISDCVMNLNKLFLNRKLFSAIRRSGDKLLYIPFPAKTIATAIRIFILSLYSKREINALLVMTGEIGNIGKLLFRMSKVRVFVLSELAENFYKTFLPPEKVVYLKTGVDTAKFMPVSDEITRELKEKYGFNPDIPVVLHVGHLKQGRNVLKLTGIAKKYQVLLVTSTLTKDEQDPEIRLKLQTYENIKIIDDYIRNIEEIYQMSDVYFFPTAEKGNCIDVPLSCLEAASCNKPVITTSYGEMSRFVSCEGFYHLKTASEEEINDYIELALSEKNNVRNAVLDYDWDNACNTLIEKCKS